jgi:hypothetical protein
MNFDVVTSERGEVTVKISDARGAVLDLHLTAEERVELVNELLSDVGVSVADSAYPEHAWHPKSA